MKYNIYEIDDLDKLKTLLLQKKSEKLIDELYQQLIIFSDYKNVEEWNKAVRICESLTILAWGNHEPLQAIRGVFFNGNPTTGFYNKFSEQRFVDAIWSKRKTGLTMEQGRTSYFESPSIKNKSTLLHDYSVKEEIQDLKLNKQRNWIPKNPIKIGRSIQNCYESSLKLAENIEQELMQLLNIKMKPENYGSAVNQLSIKLLFSHAMYHQIGNYRTFTQTNYVIAEENLKLKKKDFSTELKKLYSQEEINKYNYYLRNKFEIGPFRKDTGKQTIHIFLDKEFSELPYLEQKKRIVTLISEVLGRTIVKQSKKKLDYNFELMFTDFKQILNEWSR